jgi:D-amino peptidase
VKIYISVDMEGIAGVTEWPQTENGSADYAAAREWMLEETNAAITGALEAGATQVVVNDSHSSMRNLLHHCLHPEAHLITGGLKDQAMMAGIDDSFDAAMFVGYHASGGSFGVLAHTWTSKVTGVRLNGAPVGEWGLNAMIAGHYGVPVVLATGDDRLAVEIQAGIGPVETVVVKRALSRYAAENLPRAQVTEAIRKGAKASLSLIRTVEPYKPSLPIRLEVDLAAPQQADGAAMLPGAERLGPLSVAFTAPDALQAFRAFYSFMALVAYAG